MYNYYIDETKHKEKEEQNFIIENKKIERAKRKSNTFNYLIF